MASNTNESDIIKLGTYVVIQRQNYTKLHKFNNVSSCASLGREQVELAKIDQCKYFTTFKMIPKGKGKQRLYTLEATDDVSPSIKDALNIQESGADNRNIVDDGRSQKLSTEEITALRETTKSSADIVETLVMNSSTFNSKTEYSQEKYLKKKEKKYFEFLTIRKPTIRLIADIMYRQDASKVLGLRSDTLSQLLSYANVNSLGNHLLYESGTGGLLPAAVLNLIGSGTNGYLVHAHPGNTAQKQGLLAMNYPDEQLNRCISVNIYSVLRDFYQEKNVTFTNNKRENELELENKQDKPPQHWMIENERACKILKGKVDSLIIAVKEHPMSIFKALLPFIKDSRPFVIYGQYQEPLQECYVNMRKMHNVTGLKMTSSWMRGYQVLTNRTHPDVMMAANSGFLLTGWIVQS
ncbi:tRNA methyltransferase 6 non-catalytic subunit isoform X2 [Arctopsyche grandis]|uniref:tRNA methyltransferase 6 non-catalytic subunit isoform X2 n=1 Tax=Arctopsyche grandis TaxID=121162 RepID=UPI00406D74D2